MKNVKGKTAYVSGAASGIGFGITAALAQAGARVAMIDIRADALAEANARLHNLGDQVETFVSDVSDAAVLAETAREIDAKFGPLHIVCNNAGVSMLGMPLEEISLADWDWVIDVNIKGVINGIHTFVPRMKAHGGEAAISSTRRRSAGCRSIPNFRTGAYSMTKYAVVALSEALENELAGHQHRRLGACARPRSIPAFICRRAAGRSGLADRSSARQIISWATCSRMACARNRSADGS